MSENGASTPSLPAAPLWMRGAAAVIRRLPAGRYRAMNWLSSRPRRFQATMQAGDRSLRFICNLEDSIAREVCFMGHYEPQETKLLEALQAPGATFVDVGANWGYFTLRSSVRVGPKGQVISFEPDPRLFALLQSNCQLNHLGNVELLQIAAAAENSTLSLAGFEEGGDNWGISRLVDKPTGGSVFQVPARPLDEVLDERKVDAVDVLKMDIEGAEGWALQGMAAGIRRHRYRRILLELHPQLLAEHDQKVDDAIAPLYQAGYKGWWIDHSPEAVRRAAYSRDLRPFEYLRPLDRRGSLDAWPHTLWLAPGCELPQ